MAASSTPYRLLHVPSYSTILYPVSLPFGRNVYQTISGGKLLILITLVMLCFFVSFIAGGDPFHAPKRLGWIATAFLPLTVALGSKNNLVGISLGLGYEKVFYFPLIRDAYAYETS